MTTLPLLRHQVVVNNGGEVALRLGPEFAGGRMVRLRDIDGTESPHVLSAAPLVPPASVAQLPHLYARFLAELRPQALALPLDVHLVFVVAPPGARRGLFYTDQAGVTTSTGFPHQSVVIVVVTDHVGDHNRGRSGIAVVHASRNINAVARALYGVPLVTLERGSAGTHALPHDVYWGDQRLVAEEERHHG